MVLVSKVSQVLCNGIFTNKHERGGEDVYVHEREMDRQHMHG